MFPPHRSLSQPFRPPPPPQSRVRVKAAQAGAMQAAQLLLDNGAAINARDKNGVGGNATRPTRRGARAARTPTRSLTPRDA